MYALFLALLFIGLAPPLAAAQQPAKEPVKLDVRRTLQSPSSVLRLLDPQLQQLIRLNYEGGNPVSEQRTKGNSAPPALPTTNSGVISNTLNFPWRYVGYLEVRRSETVSGTCTGTMISAHVVLTAAHCLYDEKQGYLTDVTFIPARNAGLEPLGRYKAKKTVQLNPITGRLNTNFDLAFVVLEDSPFTEAAKERFIPVGIVTDAHFQSGSVPLSIVAAGYPTDKLANVNRGILTIATTTAYRNPKQPKYRTADGFSETSNQFEHKALTEEGTSGGPVFVYHPQYNQFALVGVISMRRTFEDGSDWAAAIKINSITQAAIQKAVRQFEAKP